MKRLTAIILLGLFMTGCTENQVVGDLQLVIDAVQAVLPFLGGTVPAGVISSVDTYLSVASQAVSKASTILASNETPAQKALDIAAAFSGVLAPNVPAPYSNIAAAVQQVATLIGRFLADEGVTATKAMKASVPQHFSSADKQKLALIKVKADAIVVQLNARH